MSHAGAAAGVGEVIDIGPLERNLIHRIERFRAIERPSAPDEWYYGELAALSVHHRQLGICQLLARLDWLGFKAGLTASAETRLRLLDWTIGSDVQADRVSFVSNHGPFFDALVAGRDDLARRIASGPRQPYTKDYEYLDDRCYTLYLFEAVLRDGGLGGESRTEAMHALLDDFLEAAEGVASPRYELCRALLESDGAGFAEALEDLVMEHRLVYDQEAEGLVADAYRFRTEQYVFVEGMALRTLGRRAGFALGALLPSMPEE